jgi:putative two-component system response regulator
MLQQLELLFNRSLFLADDLNNELESKQGRLLQQEVEQLTASEAMLTINREMARLADAKYLFDLESAKRVAKNAVAVADELKLSRSERQTLYCAALLKDLRLVSDPHEIFEDRIASSLEKESNLGVQLSTVKKALSQLTLLAPVLSLAQQRYEGYDGTGRLPGLKGAKIPMAAEILAIVDTFDASTSGSHGQTLEPEAAVRKIAADAGHRFNPEVVSAFIQVWRRTGLNVASSKASLEV